MDDTSPDIIFSVPKLINLVIPHEALYNPRHARFRDIKYTTALWKRIAGILGTNEFEAKTKWQNLRSNFMRERRKRSGTKKTAQTWVFYKKLLFLEKFLKFEPYRGSESDGEHLKKTLMTAEEVVDDDSRPQVTTNAKVEDPSFELLDVDDVSSEAGSSRWGEPHHFSPSHLKSYENSISSPEDPLQVRNCNCRAEDSDLSFFKGLIPHIKRLGDKDNLAFKREVVQLLEQKLDSSAWS
ncbi:hypothetical protein GE061_019169 [Apolygus lucorum]|uniref:MADF domain-containing protein n=1 Tax=Apolygus lucorum TaxID=248454 RepID=A0A6A4JJL1_APOLU|nr:hypothetical protein GE061_019169 [Apolygus lucorum]